MPSIEEIMKEHSHRLAEFTELEVMYALVDKMYNVLKQHGLEELVHVECGISAEGMQNTMFTLDIKSVNKAYNEGHKAASSEWKEKLRELIS